VFPTEYEKCYLQKWRMNSVQIMRHKCRYGGSNNALIERIHMLKKTTSIYTFNARNMFLLFYS